MYASANVFPLIVEVPFTESSEVSRGPIHAQNRINFLGTRCKIIFGSPQIQKRFDFPEYGKYGR